MSDSTGFGGFSLLELFKLEAESHCAALSEGLLALEKSPGDRSVVEPLMRAAHSIKGAARIVGLDVLVALAHVMEEKIRERMNDLAGEFRKFGVTTGDECWHVAGGATEIAEQFFAMPNLRVLGAALGGGGNGHRIECQLGEEFVDR